MWGCHYLWWQPLLLMPKNKKIPPIPGDAVLDTTLSVVTKVPKKVPKKAAGKKVAAVHAEVITEPAALHAALLSLQEALAANTLAKNKTPLHFQTLADVRSKFIPFDNLMLEYLWGCRGLPQHTIGEIIGPEGIGKTTLALWLAGRGNRGGMPVFYIETEGKPMLLERMIRNFSSNREEANKMARQVTYCECRELKQSVTYIEEWAKVLREDIRYPINLPAMVIIDTWGKMMSAAEAAGYFLSVPEHASPEAKRKKKDVGEATNWGHSSFAHDWVRRLPHFLESRNIVIILVQHQNIKMDMGAGGPAISTGQMYNKTKIGGKAFDQLAAWQLILGSGQQWKTSDGQLLGQDVMARMDKNSYGARGRKALWKLRNEMLMDTETYLAPSLHFEIDGARWLLDSKLTGASHAQGRYTCESMGVQAAPPGEFWDAVMSDPRRVAAIAKALKIEGYDDVVDKIIAAV